ncbi:hypothetical protein BN134_2024 [Cronobacter dublinensis 1210]|uniref:Uncharacterized protein n=1 Tax=Cronobacter dublinensis 1210 TaxID=1208656 RepID=A0ABP1W6W5_9ENTR|nr:hypothetical protein BN134_2024 [Cronobacter dublinensis 1210]
MGQLQATCGQKINQGDVCLASHWPPVIKQGTERLTHHASSDSPCQGCERVPQRIRAASPLGRHPCYSDLKVVTPPGLRQVRMLRSMYAVNDKTGAERRAADNWLVARGLLQFTRLPGITFTYGCLDV